MIVEAIDYNEQVLHQYISHAYVVMPNHVHLLLTPKIELALITKSLKGITARRANATLAASGETFWQKESYDHVVRRQDEFERIRRYIEQNPVRAGLVADAADYRWSSAGRPGVALPTKGSAPQIGTQINSRA